MKINFNKALIGYTGEVIKEGEVEVQLKTIAINALLGVMETEQPLTGVEKVRRDSLAGVIYNSAKAANPVEMSLEDVVLIKELINKVYLAPAVVAAAYRAIEEA